MFGGGLHRLGVDVLGGSPAKDCVSKVASECVDLNQFICKMDELVFSYMTTAKGKT